MIYKYETLLEYLNSIFEEKKKRNSLFSLRAWARHLGYKSPSLLSQILKSERKANVKLIEAISKTESLSEEEERYLQLLYIKHSVDTSCTSIFNTMFEAIRPDMRLTYDFLKKFDCFSSWCPFFVVELTKVGSFTANKENIVSALSGVMESDEVEGLLNELVKSELLKLENGIYIKGVSGGVTFEPEVANASVKLFHSSSLDRAKNALMEQDRSVRDIRSTIVAIDSRDYEEACRIIQEAHKKISGLASKRGESNRVYQFNSQLYMPSPF